MGWLANIARAQMTAPDMMHAAPTATITNLQLSCVSLLSSTLIALPDPRAYLLQ
jgi:hypothetical protein